MNSLTRLQIYDDSDTEEEKNEKLCERLPAPEFVKTSKKNAPTNEVNDEGKVRNFPHERGNWATYIHLPVETTPEFLKYVSQLTEFFSPLNLKLVDSFHISLTRTVVLKHHWIEDFTASVKSRLCHIDSFKIQIYNLKTYCNEQRTRTFLSLKVEEGVENLKEIVKEIDNCLKDYNLQTYYENPSFHLSLLWTPGDKTQEINKLINLLPSKFEEFSLSLNISLCVCVSGNKKFHFKLANI